MGRANGAVEEGGVGVVLCFLMIMVVGGGWLLLLSIFFGDSLFRYFPQVAC